MMNVNLFNKILVIGTLFLLICGAIFPSISVVSKEIEILETINAHDEKVVTCYIFDKKGNSKQEMVLSSDDYERFYSMFKELNHRVTYSPFSSETEVLKTEFVDLIDNMGMIPEDSSKEDIISLLNYPLGKRRPLFSLLPNPIYNGRGSAFFCNFLTWGEGSQFPVIILPRLIPILLVPIPRVIMRWNAVDGITSCGGLLSGKGFIAEGAQKGTALGFWGIGFSVFLPPVMSFGFIGYALYATASAEVIHPWPPNRPPVVSGENPADGSVDVPLSLSELSFSLSDEDGDIMNYSVSTAPDIGGGSGNNVGDGVFSVPVSGLDSNTEYSWQVVVSDGEDITEKTFSFHTEIEPPFVSEPQPVDGDSWVSVDISELSFRLEDFQSDPMDYTVETVPFIGGGSGSGVGNGFYSVTIGGLEYTRDYTWFVNVTDGKFWTRKVFSFKTQPIMVFDPFDMGWQFRKMITINHSMVAGDLVDFPVLISLTDVDLRDKAQEGGDDVLFMDGDGVASRLFHEIELFDGSSGELVCWVNVSSLSSGVDSVFYLYYGNSGCDSQEYADMVWDSDYIHVWHLGDNLCDTVGVDDGTNHGTSIVTGKIGAARNFVRSDSNYIDWGDMLEPADGDIDKATFNVWLNIKDIESSNPLIVKFNSGDYEPDRASYFVVAKDGKIMFRAYRGTWDMDGNTIQGTTNQIISPDQWHYLTVVTDLSNQNVDIYLNGNEQEIEKEIRGNPPKYFYNIALSDKSGRLTWEGPTRRYLDGTIDELRISKIDRSSSWILTEFNNQNDLSSFMSIGPEESGP